MMHESRGARSLFVTASTSRYLSRNLISARQNDTDCDNYIVIADLKKISSAFKIYRIINDIGVRIDLIVGKEAKTQAYIGHLVRLNQSGG